MTNVEPTPRWAYELHCDGIGCLYVASDSTLPMSIVARMFYYIRGHVLTKCFRWWRYEAVQNG